MVFFCPNTEVEKIETKSSIVVIPILCVVAISFYLPMKELEIKYILKVVLFENQ